MTAADADPILLSSLLNQNQSNFMGLNGINNGTPVKIAKRK